MKNYNEMAESVFERRDKYNAERRLAISKIKKSITGAVCCCLVALLGLGIFNGTQIAPNDTPNAGVQDYHKNKLEADKEEVGSDQVANPVQNVEDVPADKDGDYNESIRSDDLQQGTTAFFGGSYTDTNGKFIVVLTVDTAENRTAICKELGVNESTTVFETGTYTLEYLTELQNKISSAMTNKELPFVTSSAVDEIGNRIRVSVTTDNEADLAKVFALDTIGGAVAIERSAGIASEDLAVAE